MKHVNWETDPKTIFSISPIIPVMVIQDIKDALPLAKAIVDGGINILEVTLRTSVALEAIQLIHNELPNVVVGAGTIITENQLDSCIEVGARFAISPGLTKKLLKISKEKMIPFIPGASTVSEIMAGIEEDFHFFKFFPAENSGGVEFLRAIFSPFPNLRFCPTGGIKETNFVQYLSLPNVSCVGGSWVIPDVLVKNKDWGKITELCSSNLKLFQK